MKPIHRHEFPIHYAKGKKLFQVVIKLSDAAGSLQSILDLLGPRVNLIGLSSYTLEDGTAMFSAFAEVLKESETPASLKKAIRGSKAALEVEVLEGRDGLLVDALGAGPVVGRDEYLMLMREGMDGVFDHIVKIFGSGGDVLLYEEGTAMAQKIAQRFIETLGLDVIKPNIDYLANSLTAEGWGKVVTKPGPGGLEFRTTVKDCFECASSSGVRKQCSFVRGYFEGSSAASFGVQMKAEEVECRLRGDKACVFVLKPRNA